ncbi:glycoside hydrolase family 31 protein [Tumebacillus sp. DT12]|uniref:Glycoside hydrolase family 31 protein n=1 Tax=Tumebacillus lacus TaxID=2995335 RepID=A0ABT3X169_9BACL|nr:glycoside hydrolase family 31 protein [Tumebacillus lacus]MCX7570643.1 glycoside hydrolase family 31 protein [Tumebacillus lacus]
MQGSEAIKPENYEVKDGVTYFSVGEVLGLDKSGNAFELLCENAVVGLQFLTDKLFRVKLSRQAKAQMTFGPMIETHATVAKVDVLAEESAESYHFETAELVVEVQKQPYRLSVYDKQGTLISADTLRGMGWTDKNGTFCSKDAAGEDFYGFGEKTGDLNKKGSVQSMWNTDVYAPHNPEINELYESIPFFHAKKPDGTVYGFFLDNPGKTRFDLQAKDSFRLATETGDLDYYFFYGPTLKDLVAQYTYLTGRMPLPPKWALGYHQSRYSYETEGEVRELANNFRNMQIPCDVIYLDIHYMDEYRVFTWHPTRFPQPKHLLEDLRDDGFRVVPIVDPGVKKDPKYPIYQQGLAFDHFCKYIEGDLYIGKVWPGESALPDFTDGRTRQWWGEKHVGLVEAGIEGIWNDMNEPAIFNETKTMDVNVMHRNDGDPKTHGELHNLYGLYMSMATYEGMKEQMGGKRPFVLTRAGYAGIQKYAAVWTGDNRSFWEHLEMSLPMILNMGLSGIPFAGADVGGFAFDTNAELLTRWTQVGAFLPYFRNHSAIGFVRQEPWSFGEPYGRIIKRYIEMRYEFLPHLYTLFHEASTTGLPVVRPLVLEYPLDSNVRNLSDQFLFGSNILVAPILRPDQTMRAVYLPEGTWIDFHTGESHEGGRHVLAEAQLERMPLYVKAGTVYAGGNVIQHTGEKQEITYHLYKGNGSYVHYDDNGETFDYQQGQFNLLSISQRVDGEKLYIHWDLEHQGFESGASGQPIRMQVHFVEEPKRVEGDGVVSTYDRETRTLSLSVGRNVHDVVVEF